MLHISHEETHQSYPHLLSNVVGSHQVVTIGQAAEQPASLCPTDELDSLNGQTHHAARSKPPIENNLDGWL